MRKVSLAMVAALALLTFALPGTSMAAQGGNADAATLCQASWDDLGFKNRGACVSAFAHDDSLNAVQVLCTRIGGQYLPTSGDLIHRCLAFISEDTFHSSMDAFRSACASLGMGLLTSYNDTTRTGRFSCDP